MVSGDRPKFKQLRPRLMSILLPSLRSGRPDDEGQFGRPEFFAKDGVKNRMDEKFPHHPLMRSEARFGTNSR